MRTISGIIRDVLDNTDTDEIVTVVSVDKLTQELCAALAREGFQVNGDVDLGDHPVPNHVVTRIRKVTIEGTPNDAGETPTMELFMDPAKTVARLEARTIGDEGHIGSYVANILGVTHSADATQVRLTWIKP